MLDFVANAILNKKMVGWFQDRMEWGPRALGNRSILANPAIPNIKSIINSKIKRRESFRPFAPSILQEHVEDWFDENHESLFMSFVTKVNSEKKNIIPSVVHIDGTGRCNSKQKTNPRFYDLIRNLIN